MYIVIFNYENNKINIEQIKNLKYFKQNIIY